MAHFVGTPEMESRNCPGWTPETLNGHNSRLGSPIVTSSKLKLYPLSRSFQRRVAFSILTSGRGRFPTFVVGSQTASLTPGPSFAHNLACRCPNGQCEAIFNIYVSKLSNDTKNTSMRGVLDLVVEL